NRFKKSIPQQSYDLCIRSKKTYLNDYTFLDDLNNNNLNPQISHPLFSNELNNSLGISNQQFKLNCKIDDDQQSYYRSIDQEDSNQDISSCNLYDTDNMEFDQEFDNNLDYGNLESIYENEFSDNINSDSLDDEYEPISNNIDDKPKTFDRTKPDINWNHESPYGLFGNFTNMAIFIWAT
ncbi:6609_t:CDS:1, partial [Gigaspora rosea]